MPLNTIHEQSNAQNLSETDTQPLQTETQDQTKTANAARNTASMLVIALEKVEITPKAINSIMGQIKGLTPQITRGEVSGSKTDDDSHIQSLCSTLPEEKRQLIGLLRAPLINETEIKDFRYNLRMCEKSCHLGAQIQAQLSSGVKLDLDKLWSICQKWRVDQLASTSTAREVNSFSLTRLNRKTSLLATPIQATDKRYAHLATTLEQLAQTNPQVTIKGDDVALLKVKETQWHGQTIKAIWHILFATINNTPQTPLTVLRVVLSANGKLVQHPWTHPDNSLFEIDSDKLKQVDDNELYEGLILHTHADTLNPLKQEIQVKLQEYTQLVTPTNKLVPFDPKNQQISQVLDKLGDLHFLLAHATFDLRGSAAKSELLIRALAIASGFELPPFKKGFVPDLEAFVTLRQQFIKNYRNAFEKH